jgi:hypothetical protein
MHGDVLLLAIILSPCYPLTFPYGMPLLLLLLYLRIVYFELGGVCSKLYLYLENSNPSCHRTPKRGRL